MITALIDGDWILYAAGFAGQKNELVCPDVYGALTFKTATSLKERMVADNVDTDLEHPVYSRYVLDEDSHFFHSAKNMIERNCERIASKFDEDVRPVVLIDGDGNFRSKLATMRPYKGQRHVHAKPLMYNAIRQYLLDHWDTQVVHDQETDDAMAILQTAYTQSGLDSIIVSVDKDFLQVPGWHLNPNKGFKQIGIQESRERLYIQCLTGDIVDNIGGCHKVGPVAARKIIKIGENMSERLMWNETVEAYQASIMKYGVDIYNGLNCEQAAIENMRLVYLRRTPKELWMPPEDDA